MKDLSLMKLVHDEESINIYIDNGDNEEPTHIAYWHEDEWIENPQEVVPAIINAMWLFYNDKEMLLEILNRIRNFKL